MPDNENEFTTPYDPSRWSPQDDPTQVFDEAVPAAPASSGPRGPRRSRPKFSPLLIAGLLVAVIGASVLGWAGFQYFGTDGTSLRAAEAEKSSLKNMWASESASPEPQPTVAGALPTNTQIAKPTVPSTAIALIRIPKFGSSYEWPVMPGVDVDNLAQGVGWFPETAKPGQVGNFALAGHRITHGQPFARLLELNIGDKIIIETKSYIYTYVLDTAPRDLTVLDTDGGWVLDPVPGRINVQPTKPLITILTCSELFHTPDRSVGFGHLVSAVKK